MSTAAWIVLGVVFVLLAVAGGLALSRRSRRREFDAAQVSAVEQVFDDPDLVVTDSTPLPPRWDSALPRSGSTGRPPMIRRTPERRDDEDVVVVEPTFAERSVLPTPDETRTWNDPVSRGDVPASDSYRDDTPSYGGWSSMDTSGSPSGLPSSSSSDSGGYSGSSSYDSGSSSSSSSSDSGSSSSSSGGSD